jgi:diacylglycerol kinase family enzyme
LQREIKVFAASGRTISGRSRLECLIEYGKSVKHMETRAFDFIVNTDSRAVRRAGLPALEALLRGVFGAELGDVLPGGGAQMQGLVRLWAARNGAAAALSGPARLLVVVGGDGTLLTAAAEAMAGGIALGVLPGGTQNFIARALGLSPDLAEAARAYRSVLAIRALDVGRVNGMPFLYGLLLDPASVSLFEAREEMRRGLLLAGLGKAFACAGGLVSGRPTVLGVRSAAGGAPAGAAGRLVAVTVGAMAPRPNRLGDALRKGLFHVCGNIFARRAEADGQLVLYTHPGGALGLTAMVPKLWNGTWAGDPSVRARAGTGFVLESERTEIPVILDGEITRACFPLKVELLPRALRLYRPA